MNRLVRFSKLLPQYISHVWDASKFEHSFYIVHKTNSLQEHEAAKKAISKVVGPHKPIK